MTTPARPATGTKWSYVDNNTKQPLLSPPQHHHNVNDDSNVYNQSLLLTPQTTNGASSAATSLDPLHATSYQKLRQDTQSWTKYAILLCICFFTFGSYFTFDIPGAIEEQLKHVFGPTYSDTQNLILYSVYNWPNTVLAFFGGYIIDRVTGVRGGALLFCSLITIGNLLFATGVQMHTYWLCVVGRTIFGLGGESLTVAQNTFTVRWFSGDVLAMIFGVVVAFSRIGSAVNFAVTPILVRTYTAETAVWIATSTCGLSFLATAVASYLDYYESKKLEERRKFMISQLPPHARQYVLQHDAAIASGPVNMNGASSSSLDTSSVSLAQIQHFPLEAWCLFLICSTFYIPILVFNQVCSEIIQHLPTPYDPETASLYVSIPNFVAIIAVPLFGRLVDKKGRALYFIATACMMTCTTQLIFLMMNLRVFTITPIPVMIWQGLSYSLGAASIWPILSYVIDPRMLATSYGTMTAIQNIGQAVAPLVVSILPSYAADLIFFASVAGFTMLLTILLVFIDSHNGGRLNASAKEREQLISASSLLDDDLLDDDDIAALISPINNIYTSQPSSQHKIGKQILFE